MCPDTYSFEGRIREAAKKVPPLMARPLRVRREVKPGPLKKITFFEDLFFAASIRSVYFWGRVKVKIRLFLNPDPILQPESATLVIDPYLGKMDPDPAEEY